MTLLQAFANDLDSQLTSVIEEYVNHPSTPFDALKRAYINKKTPVAITRSVNQLLGEKAKTDIDDFTSQLQKSQYDKQKTDDAQNKLLDQREAEQDLQLKLKLEVEIRDLTSQKQNLQHRLATINNPRNSMSLLDDSHSKSLSPLNTLRTQIQSLITLQERQYDDEMRDLEEIIGKITKDIRKHTSDVSNGHGGSNVHGHGGSNVHGHGGSNVHGHGGSNVHGHSGSNVHGHGGSNVHGHGGSSVVHGPTNTTHLILQGLRDRLRITQEKVETTKRDYYATKSSTQQRLDEVDSQLMQLKRNYAQSQAEFNLKLRAYEQEHRKLTGEMVTINTDITSKSRQLEQINQRDSERATQRTLRERRSSCFDNYQRSQNPSWSMDGLSDNNRLNYLTELNAFTAQVFELRRSIANGITNLSSSLYKRVLENTTFSDQEKQGALTVMIDAMREYEDQYTAVNQLKQVIEETKKRFRGHYLTEYKQYAQEQKNTYESAIAELDNALQSRLGALSENKQKELTELTAQYTIDSQKAINEYQQQLQQQIISYDTKYRESISQNQTIKQQCEQTIQKITASIQTVTDEKNAKSRSLAQNEHNLERTNSLCSNMENENRSRSTRIKRIKKTYPWLIAGGVTALALIIPVAMTGLGATVLGFPLIAVAASLAVIGVVFWSLLLAFNIRNTRVQKNIHADEFAIQNYRQGTKTYEATIRPELNNAIEQLAATIETQTAELEKNKMDMQRADETLQSIANNHPIEQYKQVRGDEAVTERFNLSKAQCNMDYRTSCKSINDDISASKVQKTTDYKIDLELAQLRANEEFKPADQAEINDLAQRLQENETLAELALQRAKSANPTGSGHEALAELPLLQDRNADPDCNPSPVVPDDDFLRELLPDQQGFEAALARLRSAEPAGGNPSAFFRSGRTSPAPAPAAGSSAFQPG